MRKGLEKGALNIACSTLPGPENRVWRGPYYCGRNNTKENTKKRLRNIPLTLGAWNVRIHLDRDGADRPQRRTAQIGRELARYNIDIAALCETRLAGEGQLCEKGAGYTFFWSGRGSEDRRETGVSFAVKTALVGKLAGPPIGVNDRLMTMTLPLSYGRKHVTTVSAYGSTSTRDSFHRASVDSGKGAEP